MIRGIGTDSSVGVVSTLVSSLQSRINDNNKCVQFYYYIRGDNKASLDIYTRGATAGQSESRWSRSKDYGDQWNLGIVNLPVTEDFNVLFQARTTDSLWEGILAIDDVSIKNGSCGNIGSCDFEGSIESCGWYNVEGSTFLIMVIRNSGIKILNQIRF